MCKQALAMATHMTPKQQRDYRQRRKAEGRPLPRGGYEAPEKKVKRMKAYRARPEVRARDARRLALQRKHEPKKYAAWLAVGAAVLAGRLDPKPCEACGKIEADAHHADYNKPLEVRWLCRGCHMREHRRTK